MILYRGFVVFSLPFIRQLIQHKKVYVNNNLITYCSFFVKTMDIVSFFNLNKNFNRKFFYHIYLYLKCKAINDNKSYFMLKNPIYLEVSYNYLSLIKIRDFTFKEIPYYSPIDPNIVLRLFN